MKISILATTLLIGLGSVGTNQSAQAAPIKLDTLSFAAPAQATAPSNDLLVQIRDDRDNLASDGNEDYRSWSHRRYLEQKRRENIAKSKTPLRRAPPVRGLGSTIKIGSIF